MKWGSSGRYTKIDRKFCIYVLLRTWPVVINFQFDTHGRFWHLSVHFGLSSATRDLERMRANE
jgi:hypothetical protein